MSNQVYATVVRTITNGTGEEQFGILVRDSYASVFDIGYETLEEVWEAYPTRQSVVDWISKQIGFDDSQYVLSENYDTASIGVHPVIIEGFYY